MTTTSSNDLNDSNLPFTIWNFWILWLLVNIIGYSLLGYLFLQVFPQSSIPILGESHALWSLGFFLYHLLTGILSGLILGGGQCILLQRYLFWPASWMLISVLGWFVVNIWASFISFFVTAKTAIFVVLIDALVSGILLGVVQWFVLRKQVYHAGWWIVASALSWFTGRFLFLVLSMFGVIKTYSPHSWGDTIARLLNRGLQETILVICLIWLLKITLEKDAEIEEMSEFSVTKS